MKPALQLKLSQQLTMTPQLQQAIRLLQLPLVELSAQLQQALAENVMLEAEDAGEDLADFPVEGLDRADAGGGDVGTAEFTAGDRDGDPDGGWDGEPVGELGGELGDDFGQDLDGGYDGGDGDVPAGEPAVVAGSDTGDTGLWTELPAGNSPWTGDGERPEPADSSHETLRDHLLWQIQMENFSPREVVMGQAIVDVINDAGYLTEPLSSVLETLGPSGAFTLEELEATLRRIQSLDPVGVGARDLAECIGLQLAQLDPAVPGRDLARQIARDCLDLVAEQEFSMLRRRLGVTAEELETALALIRSCHPKPGLAIQPQGAEYIVPDVYVRRRDGRWVVDINRSIAPRLRVNQAYADLVRGDGEHTALRNQLQEARWLVRSLEIRNETLLKVALCIVERQSDFLEHGEEAMKPMVLRDVAEAVGMHESTISRVTANKYMHTPRGVFEFRHFFSSQVTGDDGTAQSSTAIQARLKRLIAQEDPAKPLSDSQLQEILAREGIQVARRTVAKYREALGIQPSNERRRRPAR
jgi:RNA polymerase sigma-54 factor